MRESERRWSWFQQVLDAAFAVAALVLLGVMTARNSYPPLGVILVLALGGRVSMGTLERWLNGRNGR